jgi:predicted permease
MTLFLFILWLLSIGVGIYVQLRYAWTNYPKSWKWLSLRFGSSFLNGAVLGILLFTQDYHGSQLAIAVLLCGLAFGILFTFGFRYNLQRVIPKQDTSDEDHPSK